MMGVLSKLTEMIIYFEHTAVGGVTDIDKEKRGNPSLNGWFIVNAQWTTVSHKGTSQSN
jgi:hypothetical protein